MFDDDDEFFSFLVYSFINQRSVSADLRTLETELSSHLAWKNRRAHGREDGSISVALVQGQLQKRRKNIAAKGAIPRAPVFFADRDFLGFANRSSL